MSDQQQEIGYWACFYCANAHQLLAKCKCECHENELKEHAEMNADWLNRLRKAYELQQGNERR